jgi:hypothetical protein
MNSLKNEELMKAILQIKPFLKELERVHLVLRPLLGLLYQIHFTHNERELDPPVRFRRRTGWVDGWADCWKFELYYGNNENRNNRVEKQCAILTSARHR